MVLFGPAFKSSTTEAIRIDETIYDETKRTFFSAEQLIKLQLKGT